ncbi:MAG: hypothetical protein PF961_21570 [Planctomycetota bacterium]|nr:hypothetical protein [Planctomycetota bacterium]
MTDDIVTVQHSQTNVIVSLGPWRLIAEPGRRYRLYLTSNLGHGTADLSAHYPGIVDDMCARRYHPGATGCQLSPLRTPILTRR